MNYRLADITKDDFKSFYNLLENSFPEIERRKYDNQKELFNNELYKVVGYKNKENEVVAFIAFWSFLDFNFIEHFAVKENLRGKGLGSVLLGEYIKSDIKSIILEVELPQDNISKKRIEFYKKIGFKLNDYKYMQPPLEEGNELLPLKIMSFKNYLEKDDFDIKVRNIYREVYNLKY